MARPVDPAPRRPGAHARTSQGRPGGPGVDGVRRRWWGVGPTRSTALATLSPTGASKQEQTPSLAIVLAVEATLLSATVYSTSLRTHSLAPCGENPIVRDRESHAAEYGGSKRVSPAHVARRDPALALRKHWRGAHSPDSTPTISVDCVDSDPLGALTRRPTSTAPRRRTLPFASLLWRSPRGEIGGVAAHSNRGLPWPLRALTRTFDRLRCPNPTPLPSPRATPLLRPPRRPGRRVAPCHAPS